MSQPNYKLYSLTVFKCTSDEAKPILMKGANDTSSFSFFERGSVKEFLLFASRTVAERSTPNVRAKVLQEEYMCYFYRLPNGVTTVLLGHCNYPERVAYDMVVKAADEFTKRSDFAKLDSMTIDGSAEGDSQLGEMLKKYQNPEEADKIMKIQKDINEVKTIMYDNIDKLLERGEKIDDLVAKSNDLGAGAKTFYGTSKKLNRRSCAIM